MTAPLPQRAQGALAIGALQNKASNPAHSVWVAASAGSGKTKVLSDRVARLLLANVAPQKLLCLTFTKAAAAEMSLRLMQRLSNWATGAEETLDKDLASLEGDAFDPALRLRARRLFAQVLACPGGMRIQTIHSFAEEILRRFPIEAGLAPHFAVIDEAEADALRQEATDEILEAAAEGRDEEAARALVAIVPTMAEESLRSLLQSLLGQMPRIQKALAAAGGFEALASAQGRALALPENTTATEILAQGMADDAFACAALRAGAQIVFAEGSKQPHGYAQRILNWLALGPAERQRFWSSYLSVFVTQKHTLNSKLLTKGLVEKHPELEELYRAEGERVLLLENARQGLLAVEQTRAVLAFACRVAEAYEKRKRQRGALDYDDLIRRANGVLTREGIAPWVLYKLDGGIDHILVDESQDTNPGQWQIVRTLAEEYCNGESSRSDVDRTLFVVGDEKQSIFSFQGADPSAFFEMHAFFARKFSEAKKAFDDVPLTVSFRSAPAILRAVDAIFARDEARQGVSQVPVVHQAFRAEGAGRVEVWPLFVAESETTNEVEEAAEAPEGKVPQDWVLPGAYETVRDPAIELARSIAKQIRAWIGAGVQVYDRAAGGLRAMNAGDVMILMRNRTELVDPLVRELKAYGVPVSGVDRMVLSDQLVVKDLLALLQFALLPEDDLNLACVLRGPLIGASENDLMALAIGRSGSLWDSLRSQADERFTAWVAYLRSVAALADTMAPLALLVRVLGAPCPADVRSARRALGARLGPEAEDPIDELLNAAADFSLRATPSLQAFVQAVETSDTQIKRELEQAQGRVRLTTVHASKGLEAPVVFLPDTTSVPDKKRLDKLLWSEKGLPFYVPKEPGLEGLKALREAAYERQMEEYRRLLYVGLTRAADRLIVCGYRKNEKKVPSGCWYQLVREGLAPLHQAEAMVEEEALCKPEIVLADYALMPKGAVAVASGEPLASVPLPAWALRAPAQEPSPPRPLVPSRPSEPEPSALSPSDARFVRGRLMHRLLQSLPDVVPERRAFVAETFLKNPQHGLAIAEQKDMAREVLALLEAPAALPFFGPQSRAEIPIVGLCGERLVSGQVDRLALVGDEVWIVDYKTNRPPPSDGDGVPALYRNQMAAYRAVLEKIYPSKRVRTFLLWTYTLCLMEL